MKKQKIITLSDSGAITPEILELLLQQSCSQRRCRIPGTVKKHICFLEKLVCKYVRACTYDYRCVNDITYSTGEYCDRCVYVIKGLFIGHYTMSSKCVNKHLMEPYGTVNKIYNNVLFTPVKGDVTMEVYRYNNTKSKICCGGLLKSVHYGVNTTKHASRLLFFDVATAMFVVIRHWSQNMVSSLCTLQPKNDDQTLGYYVGRNAIVKNSYGDHEFIRDVTLSETTVSELVDHVFLKMLKKKECNREKLIIDVGVKSMIDYYGLDNKKDIHFCCAIQSAQDGGPSHIYKMQLLMTCANQIVNSFFNATGIDGVMRCLVAQEGRMCSAFLYRTPYSDSSVLYVHFHANEIILQYPSYFGVYHTFSRSLSIVVKEIVTQYELLHYKVALYLVKGVLSKRARTKDEASTEFLMYSLFSWILRRSSCHSIGKHIIRTFSNDMVHGLSHTIRNIRRRMFYSVKCVRDMYAEKLVRFRRAITTGIYRQFFYLITSKYQLPTTPKSKASLPLDYPKMIADIVTSVNFSNKKYVYSSVVYGSSQGGFSMCLVSLAMLVFGMSHNKMMHMINGNQNSADVMESLAQASCPLLYYSVYSHVLMALSLCNAFATNFYVHYHNPYSNEVFNHDRLNNHGLAYSLRFDNDYYFPLDQANLNDLPESLSSVYALDQFSDFVHNNDEGFFVASTKKNHTFEHFTNPDAIVACSDGTIGDRLEFMAVVSRNMLKYAISVSKHFETRVYLYSSHQLFEKTLLKHQSGMIYREESGHILVMPTPVALVFSHDQFPIFLFFASRSIDVDINVWLIENNIFSDDIGWYYCPPEYDYGLDKHNITLDSVTFNITHPPDFTIDSVQHVNVTPPTTKQTVISTTSIAPTTSTEMSVWKKTHRLPSFNSSIGFRYNMPISDPESISRINTQRRKYVDSCTHLLKQARVIYSGGQTIISESIVKRSSRCVTHFDPGTLNHGEFVYLSAHKHFAPIEGDKIIYAPIYVNAKKTRVRRSGARERTGFSSILKLALPEIISSLDMAMLLTFKNRDKSVVRTSFSLFFNYIMNRRLQRDIDVQVQIDNDDYSGQRIPEVSARLSKFDFRFSKINMLMELYGPEPSAGLRNDLAIPRSTDLDLYIHTNTPSNLLMKLVKRKLGELPEIRHVTESHQYFHHLSLLFTHDQAARTYFDLLQNQTIPYVIVVNNKTSFANFMQHSGVNVRIAERPTTWYQYHPVLITYNVKFVELAKFSIVFRQSQRSFRLAQTTMEYNPGAINYSEYINMLDRASIVIDRGADNVIASLRGNRDLLPTNLVLLLSI